MDKLLSDRFYETEASKHRRAFKNNAKSDNLEAMENNTEKGMGTAETRSVEMDSTQGGKLGRPLPICCDKICFGKSDFQRKTDQAWLSQRFRLLPKGTYLILS